MAIVCRKAIVVADDIVREFRLMIRRQLRRLTLQSTILDKRFDVLVKSLMVRAGIATVREIHRG